MAKRENWKSPQTGFGATPMRDFRDPVSGKKLNSIGDTRPQSDVRPSPVGKGLNKPSDAKA